jgi:glycosyltransferase involved in cell wall biosynthesis
MPTPLPSHERLSRFVRGIGYWNARLKRDRLSLFETLHLPLIRAGDCPTLLTVHDARPVLADVPPMRRALNRRILRHALRRADRVITVSNAMMAELLGIQPRAVIETIYNGIDPAPFVSPTASLPPELSGRYLLAVGHFEARKNYAALVEAMTLLRQREPDLHLAIVGKDGGSLDHVRALVAASGLADRVHLLHAIDDATLASLYARAEALVFPSTYEGFGIPILEAMAAGTPMALSAIPVFRELTEDRAAYFNPHDPADIADVVGRLLASVEAKGEQRSYGRSRLDDFTFAHLARQLGDVHAQLIATGATRGTSGR